MKKEVPKFTFKHMKTPYWAGAEDVYFSVLDEDKNEYGYIGLQNINFKTGVCGNLCYKTTSSRRGERKSKYYLKQFLENCPFDIDLFKAVVLEENTPSIKMLEFCGFDKFRKEKKGNKKKLESLRLKLKEIGEELDGKIDSRLLLIRKEISEEKKLLKENEKNSKLVYFKLKKYDY